MYRTQEECKEVIRDPDGEEKQRRQGRTRRFILTPQLRRKENELFFRNFLELFSRNFLELSFLVTLSRSELQAIAIAISFLIHPSRYIYA